SWITHVPQEPALDWITGALCAVGVTVAAVAARRRDPTHITLLVGLFILTLPSTLALAFPIENPHLSRAAPVIPVVMVLAALGFGTVSQAVRTGLQSVVTRRMAGVLGVGLGLVAVQANYQSYFGDYAVVYTQSTETER